MLAGPRKCMAIREKQEDSGLGKDEVEEGVSFKPQTNTDLS